MEDIIRKSSHAGSWYEEDQYALEKNLLMMMS